MKTIAVSKVTSKSQVTIPEVIRETLRLEKGDRIEWETTEEGTVSVRKVAGKLADLVGLLGKPERSVSVEEMDAAIRDRHSRARR